MAVAAGVHMPHYMTASEQAKIEAAAPTYLVNIAVIMVEMGLRPYRELLPMRNQQVVMENRIVDLTDSKTANGIADMPMTDWAKEAFRCDADATPRRCERGQALSPSQAWHDAGGPC